MNFSIVLTDKTEMEMLFFWTGAGLLYLGVWVLRGGIRVRYGTVDKNGQVVGFSTGTRGTKSIAPGARPLYRAVLRFEGLDGLEYFLIESIGRSTPIYSMGEFVPIFLSKSHKRNVYFKVGGDTRFGFVFTSSGCLLLLFYLAIFQFEIRSFVVSGLILAVLGFFFSVWSRQNRFDWRILFNQGQDLGSLVPPEVVPIDDAKSIPWAQNVVTPLPKQVKRHNPWYLYPFFLLLATACFGATAWFYQEQEDFLLEAQPARGVIFYFRQKNYHGVQVTTPIIVFYGPKRHIYKFEHPIPFYPKGYKKGDEVRIQYSKFNPHKAQVDMGPYNHWRAYVFFILGIIFFRIAKRAALYAYEMRTRKVSPIHIRQVS